MLLTRVELLAKITPFFVALLVSSFASFGQDHILKKIKIKNQPESRLTAIIFLGIDCPISQRYLARIKAIESQYPLPDLKILGIIPGKVKKHDLESFLASYEIKFPLYIDKQHSITNYLHAEITPEALLFDSTGALKYQGAIDNWYYDLGHARQGATENYLIDAIDAILQGMEPSVKKTKAVGCIIQTSTKNN